MLKGAIKTALKAVLPEQAVSMLRTLRPRAAAQAPAAPAPAPPPAPPPEPAPEAALAENMERAAQEVKERLDAGEPVVVVDVREPYETATGVIPGARLIPLNSLPARWEELKDANEIICYCAAGMRSFDAAYFLREKGLVNVTSLEGGISAWREVGGAVAVPA